MNMQYASAGSRFLAVLIDGVILWIVNFIVNLVVLNAVKDGGIFIAYAINITVAVGYWVFYQSSAGQTIGKKAMGIKVVDSAGNKPTTMTFFLREIIGKFISGIILAIGYLMILWDGKKQGLHDKIANTYVVKVTT